MRRSRGNPKPSGREGRKLWSPPDNCHHLTTSSAYGHTSAVIWDTFFKLSPSLPSMVCFPSMRNSPQALHFREANRKACVCKYVYTNISIWKQSKHYFGAIDFHCLETIGIKQTELLLKPPRCSLQCSSAGQAPSWGGLVLARSLWVLQVSWPPLTMTMVDLLSLAGSQHSSLVLSVTGTHFCSFLHPVRSI